MEIQPNVHLVPNIVANPYLIVDDDGLTLIDTGLKGSAKKILAYISQRGFAPNAIRRIIITHADADHVGGLAALKQASGARVYASPIEAGAIAHGNASWQPQRRRAVRRLMMTVIKPLFKPAPVSVDELLSEGQVLPVLGGLQVLETPGHTPGHISLFSPTTGILFSGDSIVSRHGQLVGSLPAHTWDAQKAAESVRKQAALRPSVVCPGHGPVVNDAAGNMPAG